MDLSQLIATVKQNAGIDSTVTDYDARIKSAIQLHQKALTSNELLPILGATASLNTVVDTETYNLPAGVYPWRIINVSSADVPLLDKINQLEHRRLHGATVEKAAPRKYRCFTTNAGAYTIAFHPIPNAVAAVSFDYYAYLADLVNDADTNTLSELFPGVLINWAHMELIGAFPDTGDMAVVGAKYKSAYDAMTSDINRMGGEEAIYAGGEHVPYMDGYMPTDEGQLW